MATPTRREVLGGIGGTLMLTGLSPISAASDKESKPRIKVGQIGVGHAHATKLGAFRQSSEWEVVGIVEPDAELRKRAENVEAYRGLNWMTQEQLLNVPGLQAVLVETRVRDLLN